MRLDVIELIRHGILPSCRSDISTIDEWEKALSKITPPVTNEEAQELIRLFPAVDDDCYGLGWTLLHLVETAPGIRFLPLLDDDNPWVARLRKARAPR